MNTSVQLKRLRIFLNLTQEEFADQIKVKRASISMIESGRSKPTFEMIAEINRVFNISSDYFLSEKEPNVFEKYIVNNDDNYNYRNDPKSYPQNSQKEAKGSFLTAEEYKELIKNNAANSKKVIAFYKEVSKRDEKLDVALNNINELETICIDLANYMARLNEPINKVYDSITKSSMKEVLSDAFITTEMKNLNLLKNHIDAINELVKLVESVLVFESSSNNDIDFMTANQRFLSEYYSPGSHHK